MLYPVELRAQLETKPIMLSVASVRESTTPDHTPAMKSSKKPCRGFPLFLHQTGQWTKKVRGCMHYFGVDRDAALAKWLKD